MVRGEKDTNHPVLKETRRWVVPVWGAPKPAPIRITMTLPVIKNARNVVFVAAGPSKTNILIPGVGPKVNNLRLGVIHVGAAFQPRLNG